MPITVILPNALRPYVAGNDRVPIDATTVAEAVEKLVQRYPHLDGRLPGDVTTGHAIFRNGTAIHKLQGLDTPLRDGDALTLIIPEGAL